LKQGRTIARNGCVRGLNIFLTLMYVDAAVTAATTAQNSTRQTQIIKSINHSTGIPT